jgi:hypothetical protein
MKKLIGSDIGTYTFSASAKQITLSGLSETLTLDQVLTVVNVTDNIVIYNFGKAGLGGTIASNVITLIYDTSSMSDGDVLQIYVELTDTSEAQLKSLTSAVFFLIEQMVLAQQNPVWLNNTTNGLQVVNAPAQTMAVSGSLTTAGTVSTVSTVTNLAQIGGVSADTMLPAQSDQAWGITIRNLLV